MKKEIILTPTKPEPKMDIEGAEKAALHVIGHNFTTCFIAKAVERGDTKLEGFTEDAERCLIKVRNWNTRVNWTWFRFILTAVTAALAIYFTKYTSVGAAIAGMFSILFLIVSITMARCSLSYDKPYGTERMIAKGWEAFRRVAIEQYVVSNLAGQIRWEKAPENIRLVENWQFGAKWLEKSLGWVLDQRLKEHAEEVRKAERNRNPNLQKKHRTGFGAIDKLGQALGFERANWGMLDEK